MTKMLSIKCNICDKEFKSNIKTQLYCSVKCRIKNQNKRKWQKIKSNEKLYEKKLEYLRKWRESNKEKNYEYLKKWRENNWSKHLEINKKSRKKVMSKWKENKKKNDPSYHISETNRSYISRTIKGKIQKKIKTEKIVGISFNNLIKHLEKNFKPGMSFQNYGDWHIDHIKPVSKFDLTIPGELEKCFNYKNLQPMWAEDNIKKGNKY